MVAGSSPQSLGFTGLALGALLTSVAAEDFLVDYGGDRQTIEAVCERFPKLDVVPSFAWREMDSSIRSDALERTASPKLTFVVETVDTIDACTLVIAS